MAESVNHPQHYGGDTPYEAIKVIEAWALGFCLGNAVKYISRAGKKDPAKAIEDLEKARWYLDREIATLKAKKPPITYRSNMSPAEAIPCGVKIGEGLTALPYVAREVIDGLNAWMLLKSQGREYPVRLITTEGAEADGYLVEPVALSDADAEIVLGASERGLSISQGRWKLGMLQSVHVLNR
jgi:hypothetical protein